ncbi:hypothetical protein GCM10010149_47370 [Nonomuraea roseoviolacea subsp. roseoviolacea]|uniref:recombinase family protein n=1 Tax=Nonomuraea roseoviolacea TaxID=103837 RepID=UPI0031D42DB2
MAALAAGIYARISDDTEGQALGVTRQQEDCLTLAERIGATVVDTYIDNDISASTRSRKDRPEFDRLLADVRAGRVNTIVYYSSSRLTRRPLEFEIIIQLVEETGVKLHTVTAGTVDLTTAHGRMMGRFFAAKDAAEAEETAERIQRKLLQNRQAGKRHGGNHMTGWLKPDPRQGVGFMEVLDPVAVEHIEAGADFLMTGGTQTQLMRHWRNIGFKTVNDKDWTVSTIQQLYASPRLAGLVSYKGEIVGAGEWPAVLDPDKWYALQPLIGSPRNPSGKSLKPLVRKYLLSGFMKCFLCGSTMLIKNHSSGYMRYACLSAHGGCGKVARSLQWLESVVTEYVTERIKAEESEPVKEGTPQTEALRVAIAEHEARLKETRDAAMAGKMPMLDAGEMMTALRAKLAELRDQQAQAAADEHASAIGKEDVLAEWLATDPERLPQRRHILSRYVSSVMVHPLPRGRWSQATLPLDSITIVPA